MKKRSLHRRLWRIRLAYHAGSASVQSFGGLIGYGWREDAPAYCNVWVEDINKPDLTAFDDSLPKRVKVGHGLTVDDALIDAERRIANGEVEEILGSFREAKNPA